MEISVHDIQYKISLPLKKASDNPKAPEELQRQLQYNFTALWHDLYQKQHLGMYMYLLYMQLYILVLEFSQHIDECLHFWHMTSKCWIEHTGTKRCYLNTRIIYWYFI